jgi:hypothetical protein
MRLIDADRLLADLKEENVVPIFNKEKQTNYKV